MERAKHAVGEILHRAGHHDTTVHEKIAPAVVQETVKKTEHQEVQTVVDREIHKDHYHTTIQPVKDKVVLPEKHTAVIADTQERILNEGDESAVRRRLEQERAQFHNEHVEAGTIRTQAAAPTIVGEHVHHHVYETIQPIVQKEVIQPSVVHTTVPIHEVHKQAPAVHTASALPAVSLSEFERHGGTLAGRGERVDHFEGDPKPVAAALGGTSVTGSSGLTGSSSTASPRTGSTTSQTGYSDVHRGTDGQIGTQQRTEHSSGLLNKLDPRVDSNHDGKPGFMK